MKIAIFKNETWTKEQQIEKIYEEVKELVDAETKQEILGEAFDVIQAVWTLLLTVMKYSIEDILAHYCLHRQKLEIRHTEGEIDIESWIDLK